MLYYNNSIVFNQSMIHTQPIRKCICCWRLNTSWVMTVINFFKSCSIKFMNRSFICWQDLHFINIWWIELIEYLPILSLINIFLIWLTCSLSNNFEWVDWDRPFINNIFSSPFYICLILGSIKHVSA